MASTAWPSAANAPRTASEIAASSSTTRIRRDHLLGIGLVVRCRGCAASLTFADQPEWNEGGVLPDSPARDFDCESVGRHTTLPCLPPTEKPWLGFARLRCRPSWLIGNSRRYFSVHSQYGCGFF